MIAVHALTLAMALELARNLSPRDLAEITRTHPDLGQWAKSRCDLPGMAWALLRGDTVIAIGGVIFQGDAGVLWIAGREGWTRYVKHALRVLNVIVEFGGFKRLQCKAYADNRRARRFATSLGFKALQVKDGIVHFERAAYGR